MLSIIGDLFKKLELENLLKRVIVRGSCPVPVFGNLSKSKIATLGINPSNLEFEDRTGKELKGEKRRFPTLKFLGVKNGRVKEKDLELIAEYCQTYFCRNPYNGWFGPLNEIISGTKFSYYSHSACHLDLIPYATKRKWSDLNKDDQKKLLLIGGNFLAKLLNESSIELLVLNGNRVVESFGKLSKNEICYKEEPEWKLSGKKGRDRSGFHTRGKLKKLEILN